MSDSLLGRVVQIQIQRSILKHKGVGYDPSPLLQVDTELSPRFFRSP